MTDRPIIFSAPMVRALLEGRKTQTRRVLKVKPARQSLNPRLEDRRYAPGDRLWVREAFVTGFDIDDEMGRPVGDKKVWYRATDAGLRWYDPDTESTLDNPPWKPSIHMPHWASRLTLTVTDVRVQRLQDISEEDAMAEGAMRWGADFHGGGSTHQTARENFASLWNSLHGPDAWDQNPWVVALTFTVQHGNIDQIGGAA